MSTFYNFCFSLGVVLACFSVVLPPTLLVMLFNRIRPERKRNPWPWSTAVSALFLLIFLFFPIDLEPYHQGLVAAGFALTTSVCYFRGRRFAKLQKIEQENLHRA